MMSTVAIYWKKVVDTPRLCFPIWNMILILPSFLFETSERGYSYALTNNLVLMFQRGKIYCFRHT